MDLSTPDDTICAIATAIGEAGIGILKISGPAALPIIQRLFKTSQQSRDWQSHRLHYGWIQDPSNGCNLDEVLVSYMQGPHSYSGEDVVEVNCHSGFAVLNRILQLVLKHGARLAAPGEFTRRAFLNGRIDLTQAEAVCDLILSRSDRSLEVAGRQLQGELKRQVESWRATVLDLQARIEVTLDFSDDLEEQGEWHLDLTTILGEQLLPAIADLIDHYAERRVLREGLGLTLVGKPNVGKSSLLNALVRKERAIVTPIPGTTRDLIEDSFLLAGVQIRILDTAGIRAKADRIETIGINKALESMDQADLVIWLIDRSEPLSAEDDLIHQRLQGKPFLVILNKSDLPPVTLPDQVNHRYQPPRGVLEISALSPEDGERLRQHLKKQMLQGLFSETSRPFVPNLRQQQSLAAASEALRRAVKLAAEEGFPELVNTELQSARRSFDQILGLGADADLLDRIFSRFCIGK